MEDPLETSELLAFARTVDAQSITRAAAELGLPRATVSRRLQRIEARLGTRLLRRTTRKLALTAAGEQLYTRARTILQAVSEAERAVRRDDDGVAGRLRVAIPPNLPASFGEMISDLMGAWPELRVELHASTRHVDLLKEGFDVAVRAGPPGGAGVVTRMLQRMDLVAVAAPAYLKRRGRPRSLRELHRHDCLMGFSRGELPQTHWPLRQGGGVHVEGVLYCNDLEVLRGVTLAGRGIALLPALLIESLVDSGELEIVLERVLGAGGGLSVVYPEREYLPRSVRVFVDALVVWSKNTFTSPRR